MSATVYRVFEDGHLLYVGCSMYGAQRLQQHNDKPWWTRATHVNLEHFESKSQALIAEADAIATEAPEFNAAPGRRSRPRPPRTTYMMAMPSCGNCGRTASHKVIPIGQPFELTAETCPWCGCLGWTAPHQEEDAA